MTRMTRIIVSGLPHHITQSGNRRQQTFFSEKDYQAYLDLLGQWCDWHKVAIWTYCLMPNPVHLIAVPHDQDGLRLVIGETHRRYTRRINFRQGRRGHLWQGPFASCPMDERHLLAGARYIELNPVRSKLCEQPEDYPWSSAAFHVKGKTAPLVKQSPLVEMVADWQFFLAEESSTSMITALKQAERTGRPSVTTNFSPGGDKHLIVI